jgi:thymidine kinase
MNHEFIMYVGPMFGGKTTRMLSQVERYRYQDENVFLFKPSIDNRFDDQKVMTHTGRSAEAMLVVDGWAVRSTIDKISNNRSCVVAIDEAFMIPYIGEVAIDLFKRGHTILVSSLQLSSDGSAYNETAQMFPYATAIEVCPAIDPISKTAAYYTEKYGGRNDHEIEVGGSEMYRPRDWNGFFGYDG